MEKIRDNFDTKCIRKNCGGIYNKPNEYSPLDISVCCNKCNQSIRRYYTEYIDALKRLEEWSSQNKTRCYSICCDDGYGAFCMYVDLIHEGGKTEAVSCPPLGDPNEDKIVRCWDKENDDWPSLEMLIHAAIDGFENGIYK